MTFVDSFRKSFSVVFMPLKVNLKDSNNNWDDLVPSLTCQLSIQVPESMAWQDSIQLSVGMAAFAALNFGDAM